MTAIKDLINSPTLNDEKHKAVISLIFIGNMIDYNNNKITAQFGLSVSQYNVIRILGREYPKPANISFIRKAMVYKMSDVSRIVIRLQKSGLVKRLTNSADKRAADVVMTDKGLKLYQAVEKYDNSFFKATSNLTLEEAQVLNSLLDKIADMVFEP
jgi:DNA-binding MarR family transcriptional regulator